MALGLPTIDGGFILNVEVKRTRNRATDHHHSSVRGLRLHIIESCCKTLKFRRSNKSPFAAWINKIRTKEFVSSHMLDKTCNWHQSADRTRCSRTHLLTPSEQQFRMDEWHCRHLHFRAAVELQSARMRQNSNHCVR